jgi:hypothetical protein
MSSLGDLADTGAPQVLRKAREILGQRGWSQGITRDYVTGEVDLIGAIALAAGAKVSDVDDRPDLLQTSVPEANRPAAYVAWETLEWVVETDPLEWQDSQNRTIFDIFKVLTKAAERLEISHRSSSDQKD